MSTGARIFFVSSVLITGCTYFAVNYYLDDEKQRKRVNIFKDIERRDEKHRLNMEDYQRQRQLEELLRKGENK